MTQPQKPQRRGFAVGMRVRMKGFANEPRKGWSVSVDGCKSEIVEVGDPCLIVLDDDDNRLEVFPSQCVRLRKRERREWLMSGCTICRDALAIPSNKE